ncbi:MAG TPA: hypothetical protein VHN99_04295, partial [Deinococcales bacterium]|nr:hypothetical protein [Deinococcales bacterium]
ALLRPGGILRLRDLVYSFPLAETEAAIEAWVAGGAKTSAAGWTRAELAEHVRTEYSTFNGLLETLLDQAGFDVLEAEHSPSRTYSAYTAVRREGGGG